LRAKALGLSQLRVEKLDVLDSYDIQNASKWDVDILVNNAAIGISGPMREIPLELLRRSFSDVVQSFFNQILGVPENQLDPQLMGDAMVSIIPSESGLFRNVVPKDTEDLARSVQRELWDARIDLPASGRKS
jgi:hypothetical protein